MQSIVFMIEEQRMTQVPILDRYSQHSLRTYQIPPALYVAVIVHVRIGTTVLIEAS